MITHAKVSLIADGPDTTQVRPSDWNAEHVISGVYHGTVTVFANTTSRVFTHNLGAVPDSYCVTPLDINGILWYISNETDTQATINLASSQETDVDFKIKAEIL